MQEAPEKLQAFDLNRLRSRDSAAVAKEFRAHQPMLEAAARRLGFGPHEVEDLVHGVWATFLEVVPRFEGRSGVRTFLFGILRRKASETRRRAARTEPVDPGSLDAVQGETMADAEQRVATAELRDAVKGCVEALPPKQRQVVELTMGPERSSGEHAADLRVSSNYFGVLLHRARAHLRDCLGPHLLGSLAE